MTESAHLTDDEILARADLHLGSGRYNKGRVIGLARELIGHGYQTGSRTMLEVMTKKPGPSGQPQGSKT